MIGHQFDNEGLVYDTRLSDQTYGGIKNDINVALLFYGLNDGKSHHHPTLGINFINKGNTLNTYS